MAEELVKQSGEAMLANGKNLPLGFENEEDGDMIIPRVKVVNMLSPERKDKIADEGDIINSLTKEKLNNKIFVPVLKFNNNIKWKPRTDGGGIECLAPTGRVGTFQDGTTLNCKVCKKCEFDNSKQGTAANPTCTKYINFLGFFVDDMTPIILSFSKTNYAEGRKMYSLAKVTMKNMFASGYRITSKLMSNSGNEWYNIEVFQNGPVEKEIVDFGLSMYMTYADSYADIKFDVDSSGSDTEAAPSVDVESTEF